VQSELLASSLLSPIGSATSPSATSPSTTRRGPHREIVITTQQISIIEHVPLTRLSNIATPCEVSGHSHALCRSLTHSLSLSSQNKMWYRPDWSQSLKSAVASDSSSDVAVCSESLAGPSYAATTQQTNIIEPSQRCHILSISIAPASTMSRKICPLTVSVFLFIFSPSLPLSVSPPSPTAALFPPLPLSHPRSPSRSLYHITDRAPVAWPR
jgi:hypothetical protein